MSGSTEHPGSTYDGTAAAPRSLHPPGTAEDSAAGLQQPVAEGALLLFVALVPLLLAVGSLLWG